MQKTRGVSSLSGKRLGVHSAVPEVLGDEIDLLGVYLETRMLDGSLWNEEDSPTTAFSIAGFDDEIDNWAISRFSGEGNSKELGLKLPDEVVNILDALSILDSDDAKWMSFCLLDLPEEALISMAEAIQVLTRDPPPTGRSRSWIGGGGSSVVVVQGMSDHEPSKLEARLNHRLELEKYKRRASRAFGIGLFTWSDKPVDVLILNDAAWAEDVLLEEALKREPKKKLVKGYGRPGRNDPCPCGSGKKYKKCCLN